MAAPESTDHPDHSRLAFVFAVPIAILGGLIGWAARRTHRWTAGAIPAFTLRIVFGIILIVSALRIFYAISEPSFPGHQSGAS